MYDKHFYEILGNISNFENLSHKEKKRFKEAYEIALDTRKFEIELYWRRTTYFWALLGAIFTFYGISSFRSDDLDVRQFGQIISSALGVILSLAWILANKGSKFWQENWEAHVDLLEELFAGPLFKTVLFQPQEGYLLRACPYSVSKINLVVSYFVFFIWCLIFLKNIFPQFDDIIVKFESQFMLTMNSYPLDGFKFVIFVATVFTIIMLIEFSQSSFVNKTKLNTFSKYKAVFRNIRN